MTEEYYVDFAASETVCTDCIEADEMELDTVQPVYHCDTEQTILGVSCGRCLQWAVEPCTVSDFISEILFVSKSINKNTCHNAASEMSCIERYIKERCDWEQVKLEIAEDSNDHDDWLCHEAQRYVVLSQARRDEICETVRELRDKRESEGRL